MVDLADVLPFDRLERILDHAGRHDAFDLRLLHAVLAELNGRRGAGRLLALLGGPASPGRTRSELEDDFLALCRAACLPLPRMNVHLDIGLDRLVEVDALFAEQRVIVELDGGEHHDTTPAFHADRRRDTAAAAAGFQTLRYTWDRVTREPAGIAGELAVILKDPGEHWPRGPGSLAGVRPRGRNPRPDTGPTHLGFGRHPRVLLGDAALERLGVQLLGVGLGEERGVALGALDDVVGRASRPPA